MLNRDMSLEFPHRVTGAEMKVAGSGAGVELGFTVQFARGQNGQPYCQ